MDLIFIAALKCESYRVSQKKGAAEILREHPKYARSRLQIYTISRTLHNADFDRKLLQSEHRLGNGNL